MKCSSCGSANMTIKVTDELLAYGGHALLSRKQGRQR